MVVWGIACHLEAGEPVVVAVEADGEGGAVVLREVFRHRTTESEDVPTKLWSLRSAIGTKLGHARPAAVVVRQMEWPSPPVRPRDSVIRSRLQVEGLMAEVARSHTSQVAVLSERAIIELCGQARDAILARVADQLDHDRVDAGVAALGALARAAGADWPTTPARSRARQARRPRKRRPPD